MLPLWTETRLTPGISHAMGVRPSVTTKHAQLEMRGDAYGISK